MFGRKPRVTLWSIQRTVWVWEQSLLCSRGSSAHPGPGSSCWGTVPLLPSSASFAQNPHSKWFPASLLSWFGSASAVGAEGFLTQGFCLMGNPQALTLMKELKSYIRFLSTHCSRWNQWGAASTSSFRAHLALICIWYLGQTLGSVLFHPVSPMSVILSGSLRVFGVFFLNIPALTINWSHQNWVTQLKIKPWVP